INIGLQITEKRPDGFHNLLSCFYPVGWSDALEIVPGDAFAFSSTGLPIPGGPTGGKASRNLCVRAYELLKTDFDLPPVAMHLHKLVPIGAGLGGGSADAAFTLRLLNDQFALGLTPPELEQYARQLGSDCAFFVQNRSRYGIEKGDQFEDIALDLTGYHLALVYPHLAISTAEAYAGVRPRTPVTPLRELLSAPLREWQHTVHNDFEDSLFPCYPVLGQLKSQLYDAGALYASMSGSGSTVYGIFEKPANLPNQITHYSVWQGCM
ncbi:MAG: 4-(cytidine 5'-diphospho)-2-C-methyl-D-erythritol kinase, partial [Bacteroidetes bacterium]|nr:4-(cytidine 5'-diphospho)-2-C-methyl-D-erythritol kinase [Fibrella sp.]